MDERFDPDSGLVLVRVRLFGPTGRALITMALDTGATRTMINVAHLVAVGYDPSLVSERVQVTTGSGVEFSPLVTVHRIAALKHDRRDVPVLAHTLPPTAGVDGLLGLDFLRGYSLSIDFRQGQLSLL